jgi:signal transduction histidine kinase
MIRETVSLLSDASASATYELSGRELADMVRERNKAAAAEKGVVLDVNEGFAANTDSHRGSLLCLIANNLVHNAILATDPGKAVSVTLVDSGSAIVLTVRDEGSGIPESMQKHLFKPGRSGRPGGTGLGLAISQLLARQIGAEMVLLSTGTSGTTFRVTLPHKH